MATIAIDSVKKLATTIRILSAEAVQRANSGHPGMPMGTADIAAVLWSEYLRFNPEDPEWAGRDRFVLSAGHGSMLLYSLLHLFGFELSLDEIKNFRQWQSKTPGHPEFGLTPGVETTTGPLGQGFANGVGMALSSRLLKERYGTDLFSGKVFAIVSDGDLMEGVASEAASLAGHLKLSNLIYLYDQNHISIGGSTEVCFTEDVAGRFRSYGWHVQSIDGHNPAEISRAIQNAIDNESTPSIICARTIIGFGSPHKAGSAGVHGSPLGEDELRATKENLGWPLDKEFYVPDDVREFCNGIIKDRQSVYSDWQAKYESWRQSNPEAAQNYDRQSKRELPADLESILLSEFSDPKKEATRSLSGQAIQTVAKHIPYFIGGSADLEPSNKTLIKDSSDITFESFSGRNIRFGVREHAMGSIANGLAYTENWIPYTGTFLVFSDYMRPAIRLAALSHLQVLFIFTHDSFWVGEDGPTHQPIEHIESLRLIPNLYVFRPADGLEVAGTYIAALELKDRPSALLFTRQGVESLKRESDFNADCVRRGAYIVSGEDVNDLVIVATGSEVALAQAALELLNAKGVEARIVSMPCRELFLEQDEKYRQLLIPPDAKVVSIEAGVTTGWDSITGKNGLNIGLNHFGASAPGRVLAEKFGFTPQAVAEKISSYF
ncbi:MAG: transketolase [Candidatus Dadabacteria bacterium]|nr:MAG: transketolase [Candidatus Dadabacteria bacterium]